eukprot:ctg_411.g211
MAGTGDSVLTARSASRRRADDRGGRAHGNALGATLRERGRGGGGERRSAHGEGWEEEEAQVGGGFECQIWWHAMNGSLLQ